MNKNIGLADKVVRVLIAVAASALYITHTVTGAVSIALLIVGGVLLLTVVLNHCPLYGIFKISTNNKSRTDFAGLVSKGAVVVDVRSAQEYAQGHIKNSINIPLEKMGNHTRDFTHKTVITCCRSGTRSGLAKNILAKKGVEVYNGGAWNQLEKQLNFI